GKPAGHASPCGGVRFPCVARQSGQSASCQVLTLLDGSASVSSTPRCCTRRFSFGDRITERLHAYERRSLGLLAAGGLVVVLMFAVVFVLWSRLMGPGEPDGLEERQLRARTWSWVWLGFAGVGVVVRLLVFRGQLRTARQFGLVCPSCGALLVRRT